MTWLNEGLEAADPKLKAIGNLNETLAHKPWIISEEHVKVSIIKFSKMDSRYF